MIKDVQKVQRELEGKFTADVAGIDAAALKLYKESPKLATDYLTKYSDASANLTINRWKKLGEFLMYKYLDGNVKDELGNVTHPGYPKNWYRNIVDKISDPCQKGCLVDVLTKPEYLIVTGTSPTLKP